MKKEDAEEFTQSLGQIVGGSWRQIALAKRLGVPQAFGLSVEQWVNKRLGGYVKMSVDDRRQIVDELRADGESNRGIAAVLGVDEGTVRGDLSAENSAPLDANRLNQIDETAENSAPLDAVAALAASAQVRTAIKSRETRQAGEARSKADLERPTSVTSAGLVRGDFREHSRIIPDASVDLVFTDPPYDRESLELYADAAKEAARILKPGGSMICYVGQVLLPDALPAMANHLRYWWTAACVHSGGNQMMQKLGIRCGWKPMLWFVKGTRGDVANVIRDTVTGDREKHAHEWQQAESEAAYFIDALCSPGGMVVDFFAGGGTTCVVAERLGRKWTAFEVDAKHYESAARRVTELRETA